MYKPCFLRAISKGYAREENVYELPTLGIKDNENKQRHSIIRYLMSLKN